MVNPKIVWDAQAYSTISVSYGTVYAGKIKILVQSIDLAVFENRIEYFTPEVFYSE